jgi:hypothetical protein
VTTPSDPDRPESPASSPPPPPLDRAAVERFVAAAEMRGKLTDCRVFRMPENMRAAASMADDGRVFPKNEAGIPLVLMEFLRDAADVIDGMCAATPHVKALASQLRWAEAEVDRRGEALAEAEAGRDEWRDFAALGRAVRERDEWRAEAARQRDRAVAAGRRAAESADALAATEADRDKWRALALEVARRDPDAVALSPGRPAAAVDAIADPAEWNRNGWAECGRLANLLADARREAEALRGIARMVADGRTFAVPASVQAITRAVLAGLPSDAPPEAPTGPAPPPGTPPGDIPGAGPSDRTAPGFRPSDGGPGSETSRPCPFCGAPAVRAVSQIVWALEGEWEAFAPGGDGGDSARDTRAPGAEVGRTYVREPFYAEDEESPHAEG